jgi:glycosyltransferase involved in cell wall biosynthesis
MPIKYSDKKIAFVVNAPLSFLRSRIAVANALFRCGATVHVATPMDKNGQKLRFKSFNFHRIPLQRGGINPVSGLKTFYALGSLFRHINPDLVHLVAWKPAILGGMAARRAQVPAVVITIPGLGYIFTSEKLVPRLLRVLLRTMMGIVCRHDNLRIIVQNPDDLELMTNKLGIAGHQLVLVRSSGVNINKFRKLPLPVGDPLVILPSRLLWSKGVGEFVEAARLLRMRNIQARFALIGGVDLDNPDGISKKILEKWKQNGEVEWWGWQEDMARVFGEASIICLPSKYREGVPRVLLEAAASGRPIVTTDAPGCREACMNGETGLLVPMGDPIALADALERLLKDRSERVRMGERGRKLMEEKFSEEYIVSQTLNIYQEVLNNEINN